MRGKPHEAELRLGNEGERALGTGDEPREVERAGFAVGHVPERVPGGVFRNVRPRRLYRIGVLLDERARLAIYLSLEVLLRFFRGELPRGKRLYRRARAVGENDVELAHVAVGLAPAKRQFAAGVVSDDAPDGAQAARGRIGGQEHPDPLQRLFLEIAVVRARLRERKTRPLGAGVRGYRADAVHVFRERENDGVGERAAGHVGSAASRGDGYVLSARARLMRVAHDRRDVVRVHGEDDELGPTLEDARVAAVLDERCLVVRDVSLDKRRDILAQCHPWSISSLRGCCTKDLDEGPSFVHEGRSFVCLRM